jgi:hypothetical protein
VTGDPPVEDAVKVMVASPLPALALTLVGAFGAAAGTTELLVPESVLVPMAFVAVTVKVYVVPSFNPVTVIGLPVELAMNPPTFEVAV